MNTIASLAAAKAAQRQPASSPAKPADPALAWERLDVTTLPDDIRELFYAIGKAESAFKAAFTDLLDLPDHLTVRFGFKYGNCSVALAPKTQAKGQTDFASFINRIK